MLKQFVVYYHCFFEKFESLITLTGGIFINIFCFYLEKKDKLKFYWHDFAKMVSSTFLLYNLVNFYCQITVIY